MLTFEEFCADDGEFAGERGSAFAAIFPQVARVWLSVHLLHGGASHIPALVML